LTLIAFIGSVFSPYYRLARQRLGDAVRPEAHCALNLALYRRPPGRVAYQRLWAMTERGARQLQRSEQTLQIGPSRLAWSSAGELHIDVDEWTAPWPRHLRGRISVAPQVLPGQAFTLDDAGRHLWQPISPVARIEVDFATPRGLHWQGQAYLDANRGERPLEDDFDSWQWSRLEPDGHSSRVLYDVRTCTGERRALALDIDARGSIAPQPLPPACQLPGTAWGLARNTLSARAPDVLSTLESGPFYSRSLLRDPLDGRLSMHESLSLKRFRQPWVQALLPFRMPRRAPATP
jgi:carotenoid 1,2-hydratase